MLHLIHLGSVLLLLCNHREQGEDPLPALLTHPEFVALNLTLVCWTACWNGHEQPLQHIEYWHVYLLQFVGLHDGEEGVHQDRQVLIDDFRCLLGAHASRSILDLILEAFH